MGKKNRFLFEEKEKNISQIKKPKEVPNPEIMSISYEFSGPINNSKSLTNEQKTYLKNDKKGMLKAIKRMVESKEIEFEVPNNFSAKIPEKILKRQITENSEIKKFDKLSTLLTLKFIKSSTQSINNYSNLGFIIAIDCSTINEIQDKLTNLLLSISLCKCLYFLEIPFSIVIFSDYKFQFIIKDFNENFSLNIIQRMYDCIIVDRFFTRIVDVCYFIDKKIVYPENINNKVAIIFSNGIDTYLKYGDKWINHLKNKINFCFFFNKSNKLTNENREILLKIWKQFEECTKFPVIEFNLEEVNSPIFKLYKYENLLKKLKDETLLKKKDILLPIYFESSPFKIEEYDKEYKIINNCYIQDIKVFVKLKNAEKPNEKVILPSFNILNYYEIPIPE